MCARCSSGLLDFVSRREKNEIESELEHSIITGNQIATETGDLLFGW